MVIPQKLSIICPVYNAEKTVVLSIESIINQDYKEWELIIVDDGSIDNTGNICDNFASRDKRIRIIHQKNKGQSTARLNGINAASGDYILFLDSDDKYVPNALEAIGNTLAKDLKMVVYNAYAVQEDGSKKLIYNFDDAKESTPVVDFFLKRRISYFWSICFKRELFNLPHEVLDKFCSLSYSEDLYLIYNIVKTINGKDYEIINQQLYEYNYNDSSLTKSQNAKKALDRFMSFNSVYESIYLENRKLFSLMNKDVRDTAGWTYLSAARKIALEYDFDNYLKTIKLIRSSFIFKNMNNFKKDRYNFVGYILLKLKMYKRFRKYIIKKEGNLK